MSWHWRHKWRAVSAHKMHRTLYQNPLYGGRNWDGSPQAIGGPTPVTVVLYRCDCGRNETGVLDGHWTAEEVRGA